MPFGLVGVVVFGLVGVVGFGSWLWWLWCGGVVVVGGLVGGGSCACRVPVTQVALCERRAGALSERKKAPNPINS